MAVCQISHAGPGRDYYLKKILEGKTPREARRALKRRLSNVIYRTMLKDLTASKPTLGTAARMGDNVTYPCGSPLS